MSKVLLTHSYFLRFDAKEYKAMMPYPPLGTLYAASYLRSLGFDVSLHDTMLSKEESEIAETIRRDQPGIVVIYDDGFNYLTKMCLTRMRQAAFAMTRIAKRFGCLVVVSSSDATDHIAEYLTAGADYVICGEGEHTLGELITAVLNSDSSDCINSVRGIAFRKETMVVKTAPRKIVDSLDTLPFPAWDLVDARKYRDAWIAHRGYFSLNMVTTRGCPFHCNWCAKPIYGQTYHARSPENVVLEMKYLQRTFRPDHLWFSDDIFGLKPGWIREFDEIVNQESALIPFKCLSRVDLLLQDDTVRHLKHAGCETVWVGAESGSQRILDSMEKGTTVGQIYEATARMREAGIRVGFFLQFGYLGETRDEIDLTLKMLRDCMPDEIGISISYPLPGTKFYERVRNQLHDKKNWFDSADLDLMFPGTYGPDFYRALYGVVHKKFSVWRGQRELLLALAKPLSVHRNSLRHIAGMAYHSLTLPIHQRRLRALEHARQG